MPKLTTENLYEVRLPAGDTLGFSIAFPGYSGHAKKYDPAEWLSKGYQGVRFIGHPEGTHIRPGNADATVLVDRHPGSVSFEGVTIHCGKRQGIFFGLEHKSLPTEPLFKLKLRGSTVLADTPTSGSQHSTVWGNFSYQADLDFEDVVFEMERSAEHASYAHGFSQKGLRWKRVKVNASGAEGCKVRNSPSETRFVKGATVALQDCSFKAWNQPWSWRGGAGVVLQGSGCNLLVERCAFWGRAPGNSHSRCLMVDDSSGDFYSADTGAVGRGFANGHIIVRDSGFTGAEGPEWLSPILRIGSLGSGQKVARSVLIERSAFYGKNLSLQLSDVPAAKLTVKGCNTPALRDFAAAVGFETAHEALLPLAGRVVPVSHGLLQ